MRDLAARGVSIPDTTWISRGTLTPELLMSMVTEPCVIKPTVSGGAKDTYRVTPDSVLAVAEHLKGVAAEKELMLQTFIPEVVNPGEYALIYFRGEFSHAVLKTPAPVTIECSRASGDRRKRLKYQVRSSSRGARFSRRFLWLKRRCMREWMAFCAAGSLF
ncbi:MAG: hypothetical protein IPG71_01465 [bacterium]|nr:hypothetical protein [bacterium]